MLCFGALLITLAEFPFEAGSGLDVVVKRAYLSIVAVNIMPYKVIESSCDNRTRCVRC